MQKLLNITVRERKKLVIVKLETNMKEWFILMMQLFISLI